MAKPKNTIWKMEPHTRAKHEILRRYLGAWFPILGKYYDRIVYIDGFCGPGRYEGGEDGSPIIALKEAIKQRSLQNNNPVFFFIDERKDRIEQLKRELQNMPVPDNFDIQAVTNTFENQFQIILDQFENNHSSHPPTFAFIDPFGFKGTPFQLIQRFLEKPRTEVFINIMANFTNRFLAHQNRKTQQHIIDLFGTPAALDIAQNAENRTEALRLLYKEQLEKHAKFVRHFEMWDRNNQLIYYLFFATNGSKGHQKMKEAFWKVDSSSGFRFSDANNPNQLTLFKPGEHVPSMLAVELKRQFQDQTLPVQEIREFVEDRTSFLASHMRKALSLLEENSEIRVSKRKRDNTKRTSGFPDGVIVAFKAQFKQQALF
ncbi:MAG: three-Cys-motif partner protein TcmP [Chloroflexi bacterium]|nr:three-Cys-motif partner protein TcmP [Chloroflexota bacterium]